ncbi:hypothetical protein [Candidatus Thiothrix anitrata]|uniref:Uncharacterized protein n=1 Tax=Candidatus Thiothrix anitrata TaxID=2823902 RepID=A0ABX7X608_9GAMM|nr:hypothetical protein [Candidatus Thiothrix anitrata]QTR50263.1 hypothetical protein J8380_01365 [Candidatus Thiothrix anitrata]
MKILTTFMLGVAFGVASSVSVAAPIDSIYTSLAVTSCKTLEADEEGAGSYQGRCPGTAGYQLDLLEGDIRQSITVLDPKGKEFPLDLWSTVSSGFSALGETAEWRVKKVGAKKQPIALIVRFNVSGDPEHPERTTSYLVVSKITANEICVTDVVKPRQGANQQARVLADKAATKACKSD